MKQLRLVALPGKPQRRRKNTTDPSKSDYKPPPIHSPKLGRSTKETSPLQTRLPLILSALLILPALVALTTGIALAASSAPTLSGQTGNAQVALSWTASTGNVGAITYKLYRGASTLIFSGSALTYTDTGQINDVVNSYHVTATDSVGTSANSNTVSTAPELIPTISGSVADKQARLSWGALTGATGYTLKSGSSVIYTGTALLYGDTGLTDGTTYSYSMTATFTNGTSAVSNTINLIPNPVYPVPAFDDGSQITYRDLTLIGSVGAAFMSYILIRQFRWRS